MVLLLSLLALYSQCLFKFTHPTANVFDQNYLLHANPQLLFQLHLLPKSFLIGLPAEAAYSLLARESPFPPHSWIIQQLDIEFSTNSN